MAKKVQTPEEYKAAMDKKVARRTLFFGTFTKSLAIFLAIALAFTLATIAYTPNTATKLVAGTENTNTASDNSSAGTSTNDVFDDGSSTTDTSTDTSGTADNTADNAPSTDTSGTTDNSSSSSGSGSSSFSGSSTDANSGQSVSKAAAIKTLNDATAKAASAGYTWARSCYYTTPISVKTSSGGDATETLNKVITGVDSNADVNSVVGNFLDITGNQGDPPITAKKAKGSAAPEGMKEKFLLKAMSLTEGDVAQYKVTGDTYMFQINDVNNPNSGSSLDKATNDYITLEEINSSLADAIGSAVKGDSLNVDYTRIVITAEIKDGKLTSMKLTYNMNVNPLKLKVLIASVNGYGAGNVEETYKDFVY